MPDTYRLEAEPLEHLLETLKAKYEKSRASRFKRIGFILFQINVYSLALLYLLEYSIKIPKFVILTLMLSLVPLLVLNFPLIRVVRHQYRLSRELDFLGIEESFSDALSGQTSTLFFFKRLVVWLLVMVIPITIVFNMGLDENVLLAILIFWGLSFLFIIFRKMIPLVGLKILFLLLVAFLGLVVLDVFWAKNLWFSDLLAIHKPKHFFGFFIICSLPLILVILSLFFEQLGAKLKLVEDVGLLRESLLRQKKVAEEAGKSHIQLSTKEAERVSRLERSCIRKSRIESIQSSRQHRSSGGYTLFKAPAVRSQIGELTPPVRLNVALQIQDLAFEPRPTTASETREKGKWTLPIFDTSIEIIYTVSDDLRQIKILSVQPSAEEASATEKPERSQNV